MPDPADDRTRRAQAPCRSSGTSAWVPAGTGAFKVGTHDNLETAAPSPVGAEIVVGAIKKMVSRFLRFCKFHASGSGRPGVKTMSCDELLADPANEVAHALDYAICATAYLLQVLSSAKSFRKSPLYTLVEELVQFWKVPTAGDVFEKAKSTMHWSAVGKALWYLWSQSNPQMVRELRRLASDPLDAGTHYLFYAAGELAAHHFGIAFVAELGKSGEKTPDLQVTKGDQQFWVEATAKQPRLPVDTGEVLRRMVNSIMQEKATKFKDPRFSPGVIFADIPDDYQDIREAGTQPLLKLSPDHLEALPDGRQLYRLHNDAAWKEHPENRNNVFAYVVAAFEAIDRSTYHVDQLLVTIRQVKSSEGQISFPIQHQLIVRKSAEVIALVELAKHIYVVND